MRMYVFIVDEGEVFQVKKSSYSKKIMRLLDKERRKKKEEKVESEEVVKPKAEEKRTEIITGDLVVCVNYVKNSFCVSRSICNVSPITFYTASFQSLDGSKEYRNASYIKRSCCTVRRPG